MTNPKKKLKKKNLKKKKFKKNKMQVKELTFSILWNSEKHLILPMQTKEEL